MRPTILLDHESPAADGSLTVRALLRIESDAPHATHRIPLNLALVLDRSGSMGGDKLRAVKEAAKMLVRRLWPEDLVSVVTYNDYVSVLSAPARSGGAPDLWDRIERTRADGSTNLSGGWLKGHELAASVHVEKGLSRVLLLTDGLANNGITEPEMLAGLCRAAAEAGVTTTTVGFGEDFDEHLLRKMADAGGGNSYYIERSDQASGIFEAELDGLLSLSAQNVAVELRTASDSRQVKVHHSYPSTRTETGLRLELGDLYAREPRLLLVEFLISGPAGADSLELGTLVIRGDVLSQDRSVERREITCAIRVVPGEGPRVDPEVRRELLLLESARAREEALEREGRGDYSGAAQALAVMAHRIEESQFADEERFADEARDLGELGRTAGSAPMSAMDKKYLYQRAHESTRARSEAYKKITRMRGPKKDA
jgi:Ca-activated chloride channel family protein